MPATHADTIRERLKGLKDLFRLSRYRRNESGKLTANPDDVALLGSGYLKQGEDAGVLTKHRPGKGTQPGSLATSLLSQLVDGESGVKVEPASPDPFPQLKWSEETDSTRDRAAEYLPPDNMIVANKDFQGLRDLIAYFSRHHQDTPEIVQVIEDTVREAFEQVLIECVAGALSLRHRQYWNPTHFEKAISPEALTTVVMQRYWMVSQIKRTLGSKIKGFNELLNQQTEAA